MPTSYNASGGPPDALTPYFPAVERFLGISRSTAHRLAKEGRIATARIGSRVLVRESEIARVIAAAESRTAFARGA